MNSFVFIPTNFNLFHSLSFPAKIKLKFLFKQNFTYSSIQEAHKHLFESKKGKVSKDLSKFHEKCHKKLKNGLTEIFNLLELSVKLCQM